MGKKTLIENFECRIKDGQFILSQRGTDVQVITNTIRFDWIDIVTDEEINTVFKVDLSSGNVAETISESTGAQVGYYGAPHFVQENNVRKSNMIPNTFFI